MRSCALALRRLLAQLEQHALPLLELSEDAAESLQRGEKRLVALPHLAPEEEVELRLGCQMRCFLGAPFGGTWGIGESTNVWT